jgi:hypothetical protein
MQREQTDGGCEHSVGSGNAASPSVVWPNSDEMQVGRMLFKFGEKLAKGGATSSQELAHASSLVTKLASSCATAGNSCCNKPLSIQSACVDCTGAEVKGVLCELTEVEDEIRHCAGGLHNGAKGLASQGKNGCSKLDTMIANTQDKVPTYSAVLCPCPACNAHLDSVDGSLGVLDSVDSCTQAVAATDDVRVISLQLRLMQMQQGDLLARQKKLLHHQVGCFVNH